MTLRVVALAPPELPEGGLGRYTLKSLDPASLFNACRVAAERAEGRMGVWGASNWAGSRAGRRESILIMHSLREDLPHFEEVLTRERPNLLLIGAMSICLPGAVACAERAKEMFGSDICVVLGGRHPTETIYPTADGVRHHPASPTALMAQQRLPAVFDIVVSGEGEFVIAELGEAVGAQLARPGGCLTPAQLVSAVSTAPGTWIASWCDDGTVHEVSSAGTPFDRDLLPTPAQMFGVSSSFDVFGGRLTGHVFSDTGNGCVFDCSFCSERRGVTGGLVQLSTAASRLARQMAAVVDVVNEDWPGCGASAFVEDSTMLGGSAREIRTLVEILRRDQLDVRFGGQFTIDQIASRLDLMKCLAEVGLEYLFIGVETLDPLRIGGMNKDRRRSHSGWMSRSEHTVEALSQLGIHTGAAVLFGLGESHDDRLTLLALLARWRRTYGSPTPISLNWATQHPLRGDDGGTGYRYVDWSVPPGEWTDAFRDFGEATVRYPVAGRPAPVLSEVREIADAYRSLFGESSLPAPGGAPRSEEGGR